MRVLKRNDLVGGDQASCMLEALVASNRFLRLPWAAADQQQLEGRSAFVAFAASVQPGKGPALTTAAVAAALLIASGQRNRKLACDFCQIPEGGARSRVGTLAKQMKQFCADSLPELPEEWMPPQAPAAALTEPAKPRRQEDRLMTLPQNRMSSSWSSTS